MPAQLHNLEEAKGLPIWSPSLLHKEKKGFAYRSSTQQLRIGGLETYGDLLRESGELKDWTKIQELGISAQCKIVYMKLLSNLEEPFYMEGAEQMDAKVYVSSAPVN